MKRNTTETLYSSHFSIAPKPENLRNIISTQDRRWFVTVDGDNNDRYMRPLCAAVSVFFTYFEGVEGFGGCPAKLVAECNLEILWT